MKTYRATDTVEPIVVNQQKSTKDGENALVLGPVCIGLGVALWVPQTHLAEGSNTSVVFGFGLVLILAGLAQLSYFIPPLARFGRRHRLLIRGAFVMATVSCFGSWLLFLFVPGARVLGLLVALSFITTFGLVPLWLLEHFNARRIAARMRSAQKLAFRSTPELQPKTELAGPGELLIELHDSIELGRPPELRPVVTSDANICEQRPLRILYLYNFFADAVSVTRPAAAWRLHGPVSMLASPLELARAIGYRLNLSRAIEAKLLISPALIQERIAGMSDEPLPPVQKQSKPNGLTRRRIAITERLRDLFGVDKHPVLPAVFAESGAYPEHLLLCTDQTWHVGIAALGRRSEKVIIDAAEFSPKRHGLVWEIHHVLNQFATKDIVVLINSLTDFPALVQEFRRAWSEMSASSPNNRPGEMRLRFVLLHGGDSSEWDQVQYCQATGAHHGIMALLRSTDTIPVPQPASMGIGVMSAES